MLETTKIFFQLHISESCLLTLHCGALAKCRHSTVSCSIICTHSFIYFKSNLFNSIWPQTTGPYKHYLLQKDG